MTDWIEARSGDQATWPHHGTPTAMMMITWPTPDGWTGNHLEGYAIGICCHGNDGAAYFTVGRWSFGADDSTHQCFWLPLPALNAARLRRRTPERR